MCRVTTLSARANAASGSPYVRVVAEEHVRADVVEQRRQRRVERVRDSRDRLRAARSRPRRARTRPRRRRGSRPRPSRPPHRRSAPCRPRAAGTPAWPALRARQAGTTRRHPPARRSRGSGPPRSGPARRPGTARAAVASTRTSRPCGTGLRTNAACSVPAGDRSSTYWPCPVRSRGSSTRRVRVPTRPVTARRTLRSRAGRSRRSSSGGPPRSSPRRREVAGGAGSRPGARAAPARLSSRRCRRSRASQ